METAATQAALLFRIVEAMQVPCGYERSFKMLPGRLLANRFLLGINTEHLTREKLLDVCRQIDMPEAYLESFAAQLADANLVFLGFEDNEPGCLYKVYLEFWEKVRRDVQADPDQREPALLHLGFKWRTDDPAQGAVDRYVCYPLLSTEEISKRLADVYQGHEDRSSWEVAEALVRFAAGRSADRSLIYLEVTEEDHPRRSFDINLYKANFRIGEIRSLLWRVCRHYSIPDQRVGRLYREVGNKLFGHLSGGVDREGRDYLTVYYEM